MKNLNLRLEQLEQRIAPGAVGCDDKYEDCKDEKVKGNNGWGNGEDAAPGNSLAAQPGFEDGATGASPSNSAASGDGNR